MAIDNTEGMEDTILVMCQQMVDKYLKYILTKELGEINRTHNIVEISRRLINELKLDWLSSYMTEIRQLKTDYLVRRCENDNYMELSRDEYIDIFNLHQLPTANKYNVKGGI